MQNIELGFLLYFSIKSIFYMKDVKPDIMNISKSTYVKLFCAQGGCKSECNVKYPF